MEPKIVTNLDTTKLTPGEVVDLGSGGKYTYNGPGKFTPIPIEEPAKSVEPAASAIPQDFTSSFLSSAEDISSRTAKMMEAAPKPEEDIADIRREQSRTKSAITRSTELGMQEISEFSKRAGLELSETRFELGASPALISTNLDKYNLAFSETAGKLSRAIERLTTEEADALSKADDTAVSNIRKTRYDYENTMRTLSEQRMTTFTNAMNAIMQVRTIQRQEKLDERTEATNKLNLIIGSYGGRGISFNSLDANTKSTINNAASVLGVSPDVIRSQIETSKKDLEIVREGDYTSIYDKNTGRRIQQFYAASSSGSKAIKDLASTTDIILNGQSDPKTGKVITPPAIGKDGKMSAADYRAMQDMWKINAPTSMRTFFLNYSPSTYLPNPKTIKDPRQKLEVENILREAKQFEKLSAESLESALSLFGIRTVEEK